MARGSPDAVDHKEWRNKKTIPVTAWKFSLIAFVFRVLA